MELGYDPSCVHNIVESVPPIGPELDGEDDEFGVSKTQQHPIRTHATPLRAAESREQEPFPAGQGLPETLSMICLSGKVPKERAPESHLSFTHYPPPPEQSEKQKFTTKLEFIDSTDAKESRRTVRKHVMREYRRRERWERASETKSRRATSRSEPRHQRNKLPKGSVTVRDLEEEMTSPNDPDRSYHPSISQAPQRSSSARYAICQRYGLPYHDPWAVVAPSQLDPFSGFGFDSSSATQSLLYHYIWIMPQINDARTANTNFSRIAWLYTQVAIQDPAPFHVVMGFALHSLATYRGLEEPPLAIEHKTKALRILNSRLQDPQEATSNATIGAIANFAGHEFVLLNAEGFALHLKALERAVDNRGGLAVLRPNLSLRSVIIGLDLVRAYITTSKPRYPQWWQLHDIQPLALKAPSGEQSVVNSSRGLSRKDYELCTDSISLVHGLEDLLLLINSIISDIKSHQKAGPSRQLIESAVIQLLRTEEPSHFSRYIQLIKRCLRLAVVAFINVFISEAFASEPTKRESYIRDFRQSLLDTSTTWGRSLNMVSKVLLNFDRVALEEPYRAWYFSAAVAVIMHCNEDDWDEVETALLEYISRVCDEPVDQSMMLQAWDLRAMAQRLSGGW